MKFSQSETPNCPAAELFAVAASKLEDTLTPSGHATEFRIRAELESVSAPPTDQTGKYLPLIKPGSNWNGTVSYIPTLDSLGLSRLRVPVDEGHGILHLERARSAPEYFLGFRIDSADPSDVRPVTNIDGEPVAFNDRHIRRITDTLLRPLPTIAPEDTVADIQHKLVEIKARSLGWHSVDTVTTPLDPSRQLCVEKHTLQPSLSPDASLREGTSRYLTLLVRVIRERFSQNGQRSQIVVEYHGDDYFMNEPTIYGRVLDPDASSPSGYTITDCFMPPLSPTYKTRLMLSLTGILLDDLTR